MKVFIYGFIAIYIGIISGKVFSFLFDKYINDVTSNIQTVDKPLDIPLEV